MHNLLSAPLALNRTRGHGTAGAVRTQVPASRSASPEQPQNGKATAWGVAPELFFSFSVFFFLFSNSSFHLLKIPPFVPIWIFPYLVIPPCWRWRGVCWGQWSQKGFLRLSWGCVWGGIWEGARGAPRICSSLRCCQQGLGRVIGWVCSAMGWVCSAMGWVCNVMGWILVPWGGFAVLWGGF